MRWLLITNIRNPGDIWVRMGVERIIRHFDPDPKFILCERDAQDPDSNHSICNNKEKPKFDYSVVCGMPVLWSHWNGDKKGVNSCVNHGAWEALNSWASADRKMIICGFGVFLTFKETPEQYNLADPSVVPALGKLFGRCRLVYSRTPLAGSIYPGMPWAPCPSVVIVPPSPQRDLKICNLMPGGGHYSYMDKASADAMAGKLQKLSDQLRHNGFFFLAHHPGELKFALSLGWRKDQVMTWREDGGDRLLSFYSRCHKYVGNRIHGGIVSRAAGADSIVIGYDTRLAAVKALGATIYTPQNLPDLQQWIDRPAQPPPFSREAAWKEHLELWKNAVA